MLVDVRAVGVGRREEEKREGKVPVPQRVVFAAIAPRTELAAAEVGLDEAAAVFVVVLAAPIDMST